MNSRCNYGAPPGQTSISLGAPPSSFGNRSNHSGCPQRTRRVSASTSVVLRDCLYRLVFSGTENRQLSPSILLLRLQDAGKASCSRKPLTVVFRDVAGTG